jgi:DNA-binding transcriptional ArsR family regulator
MAISIGLDIVKLESVASKLRAMAHPMRVAIIELLNEREKMNVTEIYEALKIEQAAASHHLNILKSKGVVNAKRSGKQIYYTLKSSTLIDIITCINRCNEAK